MRFTSETTGIVKDVHVNTISEPYNGSYIIENSSTSFFEFDTDPTLESTSKNPLFTNYNQNTISYTTTSKNANGPIDKATLTSGGFGYKVLPKISSIKTANGIGASLEAISDTVGSVKRISSVNNGYGYIPNPSFSPIVSFPVICKLKNNFTVVSYSIESPGEGYLYNPEVVITDGGLSNLDPKHAILSAIISNERVFAMNIDFAGYSYSSAPKLDIQKLYFAGINSNGDLTFKFNFNKYFSENDSYKVRAYYYDQGGVLRYRESSRVFYADLQTASIKSRNAVNSIVYLDPRDYIDESNISVEYYKVDLLERKAIVNAVVDKSEFILGEKVIINNNSDIYGFVSDRKGWQKGNSILRITGLQYNLKPDDTIRGVNSEAYGQILTTDSVITKSSIGAYLEKPKQFLNTNSFLSENILKIQDSLRYQKFAYEISTNVPSNKWRENYQATAHPAGYNLFAKTKINQSAKETIQASSQVKISTDISSIVRLNQKYNYLISKNVGIDEVIVANRLLTDVKDIKTSVVAAFQDISDQFDGIKTSFELKVIDPVTPKLEDGITDKYITQYDVDQMVVVLDNIIQTYGESWTVTDSDKTFDFSSVQQDNQLMPDGDILYYRQLNDSNTVFGFNKITTSSATSFTLVQQDGSVFPSSVIGANYNVEDWLVFVDGALQLSGDSYTITSNQLVFDETIPTGSQISARCIIDSHRNEFANGSVTAGSAVTLSSKPITTSKESYFVFVDGILIATTDYNLDASNNVIFNYSFNYESLVIFIDAKGVSVETLSHNLLPQLYVYKIEDGQTDIPVGTVLDSNKYILDINGVVQTPFVSYVAGASGVRKINFTEPPQKYVKPDLTVGRQFLALLYQRQDVDGTNGSTPNYQFDDISKNRIFVKNPVTNIIVGDYITNDTSQSIVVDKIDVRVRKVTLSTVSATVTANSTFTLVVNEISNISVGDRVVFDVAIGLTRVEGDELEITAINRETNTLTIKNISSTSLQLNIPLNIGIRFSHRELIVQNISTNVGNRDNAYVSGTTLRSGYISSTFTGTETTLNETYGVLKTDTTITVTDASSIVANDYLLINNVEVVKVVSKSSNVLTVSRSQLATSAPDFHANGSIVEEIIPESILCSGFQRGFDGNKTSFRLLEKENPVFIQSNKDIFVIVNGILQKRGSSYSIVENDPDGISESGDEFSTLVFTEAPSDGTPFNCFYVGETVAIENISSQFNGIKTSFDLRSTGGEIFSLIANGRPEANISANLILFIDGVYQIPSTSEPNRLEAYSENIKSFTLLGSIIDFTAPPKNGSDFEGYIYVGSINDYESIDVDATVEDDDILIQYNEVAPRRILQRTSATKVSVSESFGVKSPNSQGINIGTILTEENINWWKTDLIKKARVRESLRARRNLISSIYDFAGTSPYPLSGKTLYTTAIPKIQLAKVSFDLPNSPDDDTNKISFILPATTNFDQRIINCTYVSFVPRNPLIFNSKDELQNVSVGYDLPFDQIVKLETLASSETFEDEIGNEFLTYGPSNQYSAFVVNWDQSKRILYLKLSNTLNPVTQGVHTLKNYAVTSDNLINEYQTLAISNQFIYTF
jgi:hypothetical protein